MCVHVRVSGFSDKAPLLLREVLEAVSHFTRVDVQCVQYHSQLARQIEVLLTYYSNTTVTSAKASRVMRLNTLLPLTVPTHERLHYLTHSHTPLVATRLREFVTMFLGQCNAVSLLQGNVSLATAQSLTQHIDTVLSSLRSECVSESARTPTHSKTVQCLSKGVSACPPLHTRPTNPLETNRSVEVYFQIGEYNPSLTHSHTHTCSNEVIGLEAVVMLELLDQIVAETFYDSLRTNQQVCVCVCMCVYVCMYVCMYVRICVSVLVSQ